MKPGEALVEGDTIQSMGSASSLPYLLVPCSAQLSVDDKCIQMTGYHTLR